jgi:hypothetical protein
MLVRPQLADLTAGSGQGDRGVAVHHRLLALARVREMLLASSALEPRRRGALAGCQASSYGIVSAPIIYVTANDSPAVRAAALQSAFLALAVRS